MKKKSPKLVAAFVVVLTLTNVFSLTGCGKTESVGSQTNQEVQLDITEDEIPSVQIDENAAQTQNDEQGVVTGGVMRAYSDTEKERMAALQESYQNETAKPEKMIQEVGSAEDVTEGMLCYIVSTGEYYLPDRELTDEELLQIIDCNFRISLNTNRKTQAQWDEETRAERAELEAKVKAAGGISEEEAVEIAGKAMETDLGEKAKGLKLHDAEESYGWRAELYDITDWDEYKDKGELGYFIQFDNVEEINELDDLFAYHCVVNAIDGSICGAYSSVGLFGENDIWYEH